MKKVSLIVMILFCIGGSTSWAQDSIISEIDYKTLEKYIAAAKENYPRRAIIGLNVEKAKIDVPIATLGYLDMINGSYFWRPQSRSAIDPNNPYIVNGFQFGVNVSLGAVLQRPFLVKKSKYDRRIAELEAEDFDRKLATEVKSKYYDYIQLVNQLKMNAQSVQDSRTVADNLQHKFEKGEITLEVYNQSRISQTTASTTKLQTEISYLKAKDSLEEIIGKKLEEIK